MGNDFYTNVGFIVVVCLKYIFIPFGVAFSARLLSERALRLQPKKARKKRL